MTTNKLTGPDLTRIVLQVLWIGILIVASFWIMRPFLSSLIWAAMIVAATWPFMLKMEAWLWGKRGLAVTAMTMLMLLLLIVPFTLAIAVIIENAENITSWIKALETKVIPPLPAWATGIPIAGPKLTAAWESATTGPGGLSARLAPYAGTLLNWFLSQAGSVGMIALQFILTIIIAAILYASGEKASDGAIRFARRLGGNNGEEVAVLAAKTIRGVALGVVGTALIEALMAGIGLAFAGVPAAVVLTAVVFILCIAQIGPMLVLIPAVIWLYYTGQTIWGTILLVWTIVIFVVDHILRPVLIKKGADLPLLLVFAGVIGGLAAFGIAGLFIGPVMLAITYRLLAQWVEGVKESPGR